MTALQQNRQAQELWAKSCGRAMERPGYCASVSDNLFRPLTDKALIEFGRSAGNELVDGASGKPAKMRALESSSALVCNVFDQWRQRAPEEIGAAINVDAKVVDVLFEKGFPTGLGGTPPTLDLVLVTETDTVCAVESKFCEPYRSKDKRDPFAAAYFPESTNLWADKGLPRCQELARDMHSGGVSFERLDVAQLLKHALGLFNQPKPATLRFVWFDHPSTEADMLRDELGQFTERCDAMLGFKAFTYQEVFERLRSFPDADPEHVEYLRARYFAAEP